MAVVSRALRHAPYARYATVKRCLDVGVIVVALPIIALLMLLCALAVRLDTPGPVVYTQRRVGRHGVDFQMLKFRTMVQNADDLKASLAHLNVLPPPDFKIINDPRVTRVGRFLRKSSLDELPQLINVLRGEMSLVGPRPTDFGLDAYELWHTERLEVWPGITGLWQVTARHSISFDQRLRLDIEYIDRMSLRFDLWILLLTVGAVLRGTGE